jgi:hypothetical protein
MPPAIVAAGIGAVGAIGGGLLASGGAKSAAKAQTQSDAAAVGEQQREFNQAQANFAPFLQAGTGALGQYGNIVGINGAPQQQTAIDALKASPYYQSLYRNGLEANLQNASATGGIRGGNEVGSLANFGADTLSQALQQQLGNLGGLVSVGSGATANLASLGQNNANSISSLLQASGNAQASSALTQGGIWSGVLNQLSKSALSAAYPHGGF